VKEDPEFVVQWYKDGVPLDDLPFLNGRFLVTPEGSLDIYDAALNDNGFYSCRIVSAKGTLSAGAFLNVQCKCLIKYPLIKSIFDVINTAQIISKPKKNPHLVNIGINVILLFYGI